MERSRVTDQAVSRQESVDENRRAYRDDTIQIGDVFVPQTDTAVAHGLADRGWLVRPMQGITVAEQEAVGAKDSAEFALVGAERRNHDVAGRDDFTPFPSLEGVGAAIGVLLHDVVAVDGDEATVRGLELLTALELLDPESALLGVFDEMPVGRHPYRVDLLPLD